MTKSLSATNISLTLSSQVTESLNTNPEERRRVTENKICSDFCGFCCQTCYLSCDNITSLSQLHLTVVSHWDQKLLTQNPILPI